MSAGHVITHIEATGAAEGEATEAAAPQIGVGLQIFVYEIGEDSGVFINPSIELGDEMQEGGEGCLSVPGLFFLTPRWEFARARGVDAENNPVEIEGHEVFAQMIQHEIAHLDGQVYIQTLPGERRREAMKAIRSSSWFLAS